MAHAMAAPMPDRVAGKQSLSATATSSANPLSDVSSVPMSYASAMMTLVELAAALADTAAVPAEAAEDCDRPTAGRMVEIRRKAAFAISAPKRERMRDGNASRSLCRYGMTATKMDATASSNVSGAALLPSRTKASTVRAASSACMKI